MICPSIPRYDQLAGDSRTIVIPGSVMLSTTSFKSHYK